MVELSNRENTDFGYNFGKNRGKPDLITSIPSAPCGMIPMSLPVASLIRQAKENQIADEIRKGKNHGMVCFEDSLRRLCVGKIIDCRVAIGCSREPETFKIRLEKK